MGYVAENLLPGEKLTYQTTFHWINLVAPILVTVLTYGLGLLWAIPAIISYRTSEFAVTDKRVVIKAGWFRRRTLEMNISKIEVLAVEQGIIGRLLGFGNVVVGGTGGTKEPFNRIAHPLEFRRHVQSVAA